MSTGLLEQPTQIAQSNHRDSEQPEASTVPGESQRIRKILIRTSNPQAHA
jgi:hypothetical protein